jgi:regulator of replication initiation timing
MKLDDYIEILLIKVKLSRKKMDNQVLHWLLELRTLRGQVRHLDDENKRLKLDYEKHLRQSGRS